MRNSKAGVGIFLILIGLGTLASRFGLLQGESILLLISAAFFGMYIMNGGNKRYSNIGFIIPACILLAVWGMSYIEESRLLGVESDSVSLSLIGLAFLAVYFIHSVWFREERTGRRNWPLIPAVVIFVVSGASYVDSTMNWNVVSLVFENIGPVIIIIIGICLLAKSFITNNKK